MNKKQISLPAHGILIENHVHEAGFKTQMHKHKYHSLLYIISGEGKYITNNTEITLSANSAIILPANHNHQLIDNPKKAMTIFVIYFNMPPALINDKILQSLFSTGTGISVPAYNTPKIRRLLRKMLHEQENKPILYRKSIEQCLSIILLNLYRIKSIAKETSSPTNKSKSEAKVNDVLQYVAGNLYEHHTLSQASRMAGISQRQFTNLCRKLTGNSFNQYVNSLRTKRAAELLKNKSMSVTAIAFEVGYEDLSTFYRAFKRFYNMSPLAFKERQ